MDLVEAFSARGGGGGGGGATLSFTERMESAGSGDLVLIEAMGTSAAAEAPSLLIDTAIRQASRYTLQLSTVRIYGAARTAVRLRTPQGPRAGRVRGSL
jgi:hypothetical protein